MDIDAFFQTGGNIFADKVGFDGQFAMATIDQDGKLNAGGPAKIVEGVERSAGGASAEQNIIDQDDRLFVKVERDFGGVDVWGGVLAEIVPVHADIQCAHWDRVAPNADENLCQSSGQMNAAGLYPDDDYALAIIVSLSDFVCDARQHAMYGRGVQDWDAADHSKQVEWGKKKGISSASKRGLVNPLALIGRLDRLGVESLATSAPFGTMLDDPVGEGPLKSNIVTSLLGFDPFVLKDLFPFRLELAVER